MRVVSNAGPLISFARADQLDLLRRVFPELIIPEAVYAEIVFQGMGKPGARAVETAGWIEQVAVQDRSEVERLPAHLGLGERAAIVLAQELDAPLLIDDRAARHEAQRRGMVYFGSLRVLKEAKERGILKEVKSVGDALRQAGLRMKDSLYQTFLKEMGE